MASDLFSDTEEFVMSRTFDAPLELVWQSHINVDRMKQWWGPKGFTMITAKMDFRPGGTFHYGLRAPDGHEMWGKFLYREIAAPKGMVFLGSFSDPKGGTARHPCSPTWPLETLNTLRMAAEDDRTVVTVQTEPNFATEEERRTFALGRESMRMGFTGMLDRLAAYLAEVQTPEHLPSRKAAA